MDWNNLAHILWLKWELNYKSIAIGYSENNCVGIIQHTK